MATKYSNNLAIELNQPIDTRFVCNTLDELAGNPYIYVGLKTYCKSDGKYYNVKSIVDGVPEFEIDTISLQEVTYSELVALRDAGSLVPGSSYRITDYETVLSSSSPHKSAEHQFDVIVTALTENKLSEDAKACLHKHLQYTSGDDYINISWIKPELLDIPQEIRNKATSLDNIYKYTIETAIRPDCELEIDFIGSIKGLGLIFKDLNNDILNINYSSFKYGSFKDNGFYVNNIDYLIGWIDFYVEGDLSNSADSNGFKMDLYIDGQDYFVLNDLNAWTIKYCLDNNTNRFSWANTESGKGVIYYMKDEFNNECWYDFKNIKFKRSSNWMNSHKNKFSALSDFATDDSYFYTFTRIEGRELFDDSNEKRFLDGFQAHNNSIGRSTEQYRPQHQLILPNTIFIVGDDDELDSPFNNTFKNNCLNNTIGNGFRCNTVEDYFNSNIISTYCENNHIAGKFQNNTILNEFSFNNIQCEMDGYSIDKVYKYAGNDYIHLGTQSSFDGVMEKCAEVKIWGNPNIRRITYNIENEGTKEKSGWLEQIHTGGPYNVNDVEYYYVVQILHDNGETLSRQIIYHYDGNTKVRDQITSFVKFQDFDNTSSGGATLYSNGQEVATKQEVSNVNLNTISSFKSNPGTPNDNANAYGYVGTLKNLGINEQKVLLDTVGFHTRETSNNIPNSNTPVYARVLKKDSEGNWTVVAQSTKTRTFNEVGVNSYLEFKLDNRISTQVSHIFTNTDQIAVTFVTDPNAAATGSGVQLGFRAISNKRGGLNNALADNSTGADNYSTAIAFKYLPIESDDEIVANNNINIANKTRIVSDIDAGEIKFFPIGNNSNKGVIIRSANRGDSKPTVQILGTNTTDSYQYDFPKASGNVTIATMINGVRKEANDSGVIDLGNMGPQAVNVTYSELVELRNSGSLIREQSYRITDYVTTTKQTNTSSAGHQFDVIVTALYTDVLSEVARVSLHGVPGNDSFEYFKNCNINAWEIKYCLDNDNNRFLWADTENGKGVIYYMKDEKGNECPYDFKNITFNSNGKKYFTFSYEVNSVIYDGTVHNEVKGCYDNIIKLYTQSNRQILNNIKFINTIFMNACHKNSFGNGCRDNSFGSNCYNNSFGNYCYNNSFGNSCYNNSFGKECQNNSFGSSCNYISFGNSCYNNSFGKECQNNSFGNYCRVNSFGNYCYFNSFGNYCSYNSFGNYCGYNTFGEGCRNIKLAKDSSGSTLLDHVQYFKFGNNCNNLILWKNVTLTDNSYLQHYQIGAGLTGTIELDGNNVLDRDYETKIARNSKGEIKQYCEADLLDITYVPTNPTPEISNDSIMFSGNTTVTDNKLMINDNNVQVENNKLIFG